MLNLRGIANASIQGINPNRQITLRTGKWEIDPADLIQKPIYTDTQVKGNVQSLSSDDLRQIESMNLEGVLRAVYLYGNVSGVVRVSEQATSVLLFSENIGGETKVWTWNVFKVAEAWNGWCKVFVVLQNEDAP